LFRAASKIGLRAAAEHETIVRHDDEAALWLAPNAGHAAPHLQAVQ
jgi:hypothetical protein